MYLYICGKIKMLLIISFVFVVNKFKPGKTGAKTANTFVLTWIW
jgi:hypothetical protein